MRWMVILGSVFALGWGVLHLLIPQLGRFDQQLSGLAPLTSDYFYLVNFFASVCLVIFGVLGLVVTLRLWANREAVSLVLWPMVLVSVAYAVYMAVRPLRLPSLPLPESVLHLMYVVGPLVLALLFLVPALRVRAR